SAQARTHLCRAGVCGAQTLCGNLYERIVSVLTPNTSNPYTRKRFSPFSVRRCCSDSGRLTPLYGPLSWQMASAKGYQGNAGCSYSLHIGPVTATALVGHRVRERWCALAAYPGLL